MTKTDLITVSPCGLEPLAEFLSLLQCIVYIVDLARVELAAAFYEFITPPFLPNTRPIVK